jgi:ABC-type multidrug transport system fused ATPase/permease subunit
MKLRKQLFKALIRREVSFFDDKRHSVDKLTACLASSPAEVGRAFGLNLVLSTQAIVTVAVGIGLAFSLSWRLSLVVLACLPLTIFSSVIQNQAVEYGK